MVIFPLSRGAGAYNYWEQFIAMAAITKQIVSRGHTRPLTEINFVEDGAGTLLVSSAHDKFPQIRNGETGDWIGSFSGHKGAVWSCKVDKLTRSLAVTASGDFSAKLWCATTGKELHEFAHRHVVRSVDFSSNTEKIATGCQDGSLKLFDTARPEANPFEIKSEGKGMDSAITKVLWCGRVCEHAVLLGKRSGEVQLRDMRDSGSVIASVVLPEKETIVDLELNVEHSCILAACGKKIYQLGAADLVSKTELVMPENMHFREEGGCSLSPDGTKIMGGASDLWLREFDVATGDILRTFKGHHGPIRCVRYHPSGNTVASGSEDATIRLWNLESNESQN
jgi:serine-threonine kinase receptor-associated protein